MTKQKNDDAEVKESGGDQEKIKLAVRVEQLRGANEELVGQVEQLQAANDELVGQVEQLQEEKDNLSANAEDLKAHLETLAAEAEARSEEEVEPEKKNRLTKEIAPAEQGEIVIAESDPYFAGVSRSVGQVKGGNKVLLDGCIRVMETDPLAKIVLDAYLLRSSGNPVCYGPMKLIRDRLGK